MKIVEKKNGSRVTHEAPPGQVVTDMQRLFGGTIGKNANGIFMDTDDRSVSANMDSKGITIVRVRQLEKRQNALKWLALQTYRSVGGAIINELELEAPRQEVRMPRKPEVMDLTASVTTKAFSKDETDYIRFHVYGDGLDEIIINMMEGYSEVAPPDNDIDPDFIVLGAFGIPHMPEFMNIWEDVHDQPNLAPYDASRFMLDRLADLPFTY